MAYKIKNAIIQRDSLDESFELIDPENYFANDDVLVAIDSETLITIQLLIKTIAKNDFKYWNEITNIKKDEPISNIFLKLGYTREDLSKLLNEL
ncbi:MAG: hypothetical protein LBM26_02765 [Methanobrevibacter sp.]|nr:hypothetical protein [Methanobrevibacter sp.]